jgi:hypothetical protein
MTHKDEFRERANEARNQANATKLANVREQLLRSADAWDVMAQREERVAAAREARARDKPAVALEHPLADPA